MGPVGCPETSVTTNYAGNILEEQSHLHPGRSLKSRTRFPDLFIAMYITQLFESTNNRRHNYLFADMDLSKAVQHAVTIGREGQCRVPKPRLIQVKDVYPHPSKTYIPHCTILHQCGDDAGCCKSDTLTCTARKVEQVELYFYVSGKICIEVCCLSTPVPVYYKSRDLLFFVFFL